MANQKPATTKELMFFGLLAIAMGAVCVLIATGVIPAKQVRGPHAPAWVAIFAGALFIFAGAALVLRGIAGGEVDNGELPAGASFWLRVAYYIIGLTVIGGLALIGTWVAFGPGERAFGISVPLLGKRPGNEWFGRAAFGVGALITWLFFCLAAVSWWRRLVRPGVSPPS